MTDFTGTANNDIINGPAVAGDRDRIDGLGGADTVTLGPNQTFVSGPGDDVLIGSNGTSQYALWFTTSVPYVDLAQGYALDGFGGRDTLSGIGTVHMSNFGGTVIGSTGDETLFVFGGQKTIDLGGGIDRVIYHQQPSTNYQISRVGTDFQLRNIASGLTDSIKNVEFLEFSDKTIDVAYDDATIKANFQYTAYSFVESGMAPGYTYAGVYTPPSLISWFAQGTFTIDLDGDGKLDLVAPMNKGYASGLDTRVPFIALTGASGLLSFSPEINAKMPITAGARREADIYLEAFGTNAVVTIAHDTGDGKLADLTMVTENLTGGEAGTYMPKLPAALPGRDFAVNAHSMAVGDINGDGVDDVLVGEWFTEQGAYALLQQNAGTFVIDRQSVYTAITNNWPRVNNSAGENHVNLLVDLHLVDVNGDGYDDLIAGWGHGSTHSYVFLNNNGTFSVENKIALPDSIYGIDNQLHMHTFHSDFDGDGDVDLAILWSRYEPYYGGNYIQILDNDGKGNFSDVTSLSIDKPAQDAMGSRLQWTDYWQLLDVNSDGAADIVGQRTGGSSSPVIYLNDGSGKFNVIEVPSNGEGIGQIIRWGDFDHDGKIELVSFHPVWTDATGTSSDNKFNVFELNGADVESYLGNTQKKGSSLDDILIGTASNDTFSGGSGNDAINGGSGGIDAHVLSGFLAAYTLSRTGGTFTVLDNIGPDGSDTLISIERLQFEDANLAFDLDGTAGQVYRLYKAAFARTPDMSGLGSWINALDNGASLEQVANAFVGSGEFQALYGANSNNETFVMLLYLNALGRAPAPGEVPGWVSQLAAGTISRAQMLAQFSESAENKTAVSASIANGILYAATSEQSTMAGQGLSQAGTENADTLYGSIGNDRFSGLSEFDFAFGSRGIDTAVYGGNRADYEIVLADNDTLYVNDAGGKTSTLNSIERLQFADTLLAFDSTGNAGQVYRLYQASFDRTPDKEGLSGWISEADKGMTLQKMASAFIGSTEFQNLYGANPSDEVFVTLLYRNAMNREPDDGGKAYWVEQLGNGLTREMALIGFSESAENQAALIGVLQGGIELTLL